LLLELLLLLLLLQLPQQWRRPCLLLLLPLLPLLLQLHVRRKRRVHRSRPSSTSSSPPLFRIIDQLDDILSPRRRPRLIWCYCLELTHRSSKKTEGFFPVFAVGRIEG